MYLQLINNMEKEKLEHHKKNHPPISKYEKTLRTIKV